MSMFSAGPGRPPVGVTVKVVGTAGRFAIRRKIPAGVAIFGKLGGVAQGVGVVLLVWDAACLLYRGYRWLTDEEEVTEVTDNEEPPDQAD